MHCKLCLLLLIKSGTLKSNRGESVTFSTEVPKNTDLYPLFFRYYQIMTFLTRFPSYDTQYFYIYKHSH